MLLQTTKVTPTRGDSCAMCGAVLAPVRRVNASPFCRDACRTAWHREFRPEYLERFGTPGAGAVRLDVHAADLRQDVRRVRAGVCGSQRWACLLRQGVPVGAGVSGTTRPEVCRGAGTVPIR